MQCEEIMKSDVISVGHAESIRTAAELMRAGNIGFVPVLDDQGRAIGTLTDRDLAIRAVADGLSPSTKVQDVMTGEVVACSSKDDLDTARRLMETYHKSRILVTDGGGAVRGVISLTDLAACTAPEEYGATAKTVSERGHGPS